jgi:hypothetical protein
MKYKGINYDTGTKTSRGDLSRENFDLNIVESELKIIKNELHCNAVRISGFHTERIVTASEIALNLGLTVWFSPALHYDNQDTTSDYIINSSIAAEGLRLKFPELIFVVGCELSVFTNGFIKGESGDARMKNLFSPVNLLKSVLGINKAYNKRLNKFLFQTVSEVKKHFHGKISYASGTWEKINWNLFDFAGFDYYRGSYNKSVYIKELQKFKKLLIPVIITEFGCCSYKGAEDKGAMGWAIIDWSKKIPELNGNYIRDEEVQSQTILELLNIYNGNEIGGAFVFTFASYNCIYNKTAKYDLDMASFGIVKVTQDGSKAIYKDVPWVPKLAFNSIAEFYKSHQ